MGRKRAVNPPVAGASLILRSAMPNELEGHTLSAYATEAHQIAVDHGWWEAGDRNIGELLALVHSEVTEALECWREGQMSTTLEPGKCGICNGQGLMPSPFGNDGGEPCDYCRGTGEQAKPVGFPSELADIIIRVFDLSERLGISIEYEVIHKMAYNRTRAYRHGGKIA